MKFPCPECERPLVPDADWEYCPYCGSLLHHSSHVKEWKELAKYDKLGEASLASDELLRLGIPSRVRAEMPALDPVATTIGGFAVGGRPYHALDVSADAYDEAVEVLTRVRHGDDDEIEPDAPVHPVAQTTASVSTMVIVLVFVAIFGLGAIAMIASLFE